MGKIGKFAHDNWNVVSVIGGVTTAVLAINQLLYFQTLNL